MSTYGMSFEEIRDLAVDKYRLPSATANGIARYLALRIATGDFLRAVLENDLKNSMGRADEENRESLFRWVSFLHNEAPSCCWGSPEKVDAWLKWEDENEVAA